MLKSNARGLSLNKGDWFLLGTNYPCMSVKVFQSKQLQFSSWVLHWGVLSIEEYLVQAYLYLYLYYYLCKYKNQNASVAGSICTFLGSLPPDALSTLEMNKQALRKSSTPPCGAAHTAQCSVHTTFYIHSYSDLEGFQTVVFASPMPPLQLAAAMSRVLKKHCKYWDRV